MERRSLSIATRKKKTGPLETNFQIKKLPQVEKASRAHLVGGHTAVEISTLMYAIKGLDIGDEAVLPLSGQGSSRFARLAAPAHIASPRSCQPELLVCRSLPLATCRMVGGWRMRLAPLIHVDGLYLNLPSTRTPSFRRRSNLPLFHSS